VTVRRTIPLADAVLAEVAAQLDGRKAAPMDPS
jgi:hypothetical protein